MDASEEINYINHKGGVVLLRNGYKYHKKVQYKKGAVLWRCSFWRKYGCAGTLTLKEGQVIKSQLHTSTCKQDQVGNEILVHLEQCKKEVVSLDCKPIPLLYDNFVTSVKEKKNKMTRRIVSLCAVLLVPEPHIEEAWNYVCSQMTDNNQCQKLRKYMERYYIKSKFWFDIWKKFGERHRTNNCVEAWNSKLNKRVGRKTPNFISVLNILLKDAKLTAIHIKKKHMTKRTEKQITYDNFIQECQMELVNGLISVPLFLEKIK